MRIQITENDIKQMAAKAITKLMSGLLFEGVSNDSKSVAAAKSAIQKKIAQMIQNGDENLYQVANNIGINLNYDPKDAFNFRNQTINRQGMLTNKISDEILYYANILKDYVSQTNGRVDFERLQQDYAQDFDEIMRMKDLIDQMRLTFIYDKSYIGNNKSKRKNLNGRFGLSIDDDNNVDTSNFDFNGISDKEIETYRNAGKNKDLTDFEIIMRKKVSIIDQYMSSKYGLQIKMPSTVFSAGNSKLPSDTLIINFASAQRCPAWNECLVKHACYARNIEHMRQNVRDVNTQRSLMWQAGQSDPELMQMMFDLVKAYAIDYDKALPVIKKIAKIKNLEALRTMSFSQMSPEMLEILMQFKKINDIRLNEDGDFVGQWLLDAWDGFAEELKMIGISTTAYTCRNLNFEKIKNIIINASSEAIKGPSVARYFFAVGEDMYNAFDETYGGVNNALDVKNGKIKINIQPLYDPQTMQPNGKYYYKCPCNRLYKGAHEDGKVQCYECRTCYEPNTLNKPYYVLVAVHGSAKNDFKGRVPVFGVSEHYFENLPPEKPIKAKIKLNEEKVVMSQNSAIKQITNNAINSVREHLSKL